MREKSQLIIHIPKIIIDRKAVDQERRDRLYEAYEGIPEAPYVVNTTKQAKADAHQQMIVGLTGEEPRVLLYKDEQAEPQFAHSADVARWKAVQPRRNPEGIIGKSDSYFISAGSDVNAFLSWNTTWRQEHKYEREAQHLTERKIQQLLRKNRDVYVHPKTGRVGVFWDLSTYIINGRDHLFADQIEVVSDPIDPELMDAALEHALESGLFLSSNLHFAALETLIQNDKIRSIAVLSRELLKQEYRIEQFREKPCAAVLQQALDAIVSNRPARYR